MIRASACGKIILFGEHAVVYGQPALAVPLSQLRARAFVTARSQAGTVIQARDLHRVIALAEYPDDPLATIARLAMQALGITEDLEITVESEIPLASGLGSGAAISTAIVRALGAFQGQMLSPAEISTLVYETERLYHGTPSGIDNTVIAYEQPICFVRGATVAANKITPFAIARPFELLIANTGIPSPTKIAVGDVRQGWQRHPEFYDLHFELIAAVVRSAQTALANGEIEQLGGLMTQNQRELEAIDVSSPEIERLIEAGRKAGAQGGKLSGGGRGGNVIFYVGKGDTAKVTSALLKAGAISVIATTVGNENAVG